MTGNKCKGHRINLQEIFAITPCMNPFLKQGPVNLRYQTVSFWGGLRGAVALALSLAADFPQGEMLIAMTLAWPCSPSWSAG